MRDFVSNDALSYNNYKGKKKKFPREAGRQQNFQLRIFLLLDGDRSTVASTHHLGISTIDQTLNAQGHYFSGPEPLPRDVK